MLPRVLTSKSGGRSFDLAQAFIHLHNVAARREKRFTRVRAGWQSATEGGSAAVCPDLISASVLREREKTKSQRCAATFDIRGTFARGLIAPLDSSRGNQRPRDVATDDRRARIEDRLNAFTVPISAAHQWHRGSHASHFMDARAD